jgi:hypothetical protein
MFASLSRWNIEIGIHAGDIFPSCSGSEGFAGFSRSPFVSMKRIIPESTLGCQPSTRWKTRASDGKNLLPGKSGAA